MGTRYMFRDGSTMLTKDRELLRTTHSLNPPIDGRMAFWKFENNLLDTWNNNYDLTTSPYAGIPEYPAGFIGQGLHMKDNNFGVLNNDASIKAATTNAFSASVWLDRPGNDGYLLGMGDYFQCQWDGIDQVRWRWQGGTPIFIPRSFGGSGWIHIVVGFNSDTQSIFMYANNTFVDDVSIASQPPSSTLGISLGSAEPDQAAASFPGTIDEVMLYDRVLDAKDVEWLWNDGAGW